MDENLLETIKAFEELRRVSYEAGYAKGFAEGKIAGLNRSQEIFHEVITGEEKDDASQN